MPLLGSDDEPCWGTRRTNGRTRRSDTRSAVHDPSAPKGLSLHIQRPGWPHVVRGDQSLRLARPTNRDQETRSTRWTRRHPRTPTLCKTAAPVFLEKSCICSHIGIGGLTGAISSHTPGRSAGSVGRAGRQGRDTQLRRWDIPRPQLQTKSHGVSASTSIASLLVGAYFAEPELI
jgi:hypothetical protein